MLRSAWCVVLVGLVGCAAFSDAFTGWPPHACGGGCQDELEGRRIERAMTRSTPSLKVTLERCVRGNDMNECEHALRYDEITDDQRGRAMTILARECERTSSEACLFVAEHSQPFDGSLVARACKHGVTSACQILVDRPDIAPPGNWTTELCFLKGGESMCDEVAHVAYEGGNLQVAHAAAVRGCAAYFRDSCAIVGRLAVGRAP